MLTQLSTVKARPSLPADDPTFDALLTAAIKAVSARFDKETSRTLARTEYFSQEFNPADTEIIATCYPIETVTKLVRAGFAETAETLAFSLWLLAFILPRSDYDQFTDSPVVSRLLQVEGPHHRAVFELDA